MRSPKLGTARPVGCLERATMTAVADLQNVSREPARRGSEGRHRSRFTSERDVTGVTPAAAARGASCPAFTGSRPPMARPASDDPLASGGGALSATWMTRRASSDPFRIRISMHRGASPPDRESSAIIGGRGRQPMYIRAARKSGCVRCWSRTGPWLCPRRG
jgi:hypothetical protein